MSQYFNVKFSLDHQIFIDQVKYKKFSMLKINEIPNSQKAFELISMPWFMTDVIAIAFLFVIKFKIKESFDKSFDEDFKARIEKLKFFSKKSFVFLFVNKVRNYHCKFYWRVIGREIFHNLDIDKGSHKVVSKYFLSFLIREIKNGKSGVLPSSQGNEQIGLKDIGNSEDSTLLMLATRDCLKTVVKKLLKYEIDINHQNLNHLAAIDIAWMNFNEEKKDKKRKKIFNKIMLLLLRHNSKLPGINAGFELKSVSKEVREFLSLLEKKSEDD